VGKKDRLRFLTAPEEAAFVAAEDIVRARVDGVGGMFGVERVERRKAARRARKVVERAKRTERGVRERMMAGWLDVLDEGKVVVVKARKDDQ
jgi:hypothetical protein